MFFPGCENQCGELLAHSCCGN